MKIFIILRDGKEVDRETISDCTTVEQYRNRKFGSCDLKGAKIEIKMADPVAPKKAESVVAKKAEPAVPAAK